MWGRIARLGLLGTGAFFSVATSNVPGPPEPDECTQPGSAEAVTAVELGPGGEGDFVAWAEGDPVVPIMGDQGGTMIAIRIRVTASQRIGCLPQSTRILRDGATIAESTIPVASYDDGEAEVTETHYVIFDAVPMDNDEIEVRTTVGTRSLSRHLVVDPIHLVALDPESVEVRVGERAWVELQFDRPPDDYFLQSATAFDAQVVRIPQEDAFGPYSPWAFSVEGVTPGETSVSVEAVGEDLLLPVTVIP